jgi:metal-responsive CopG/Arc/MetJ family transcriptional regulator
MKWHIGITINTDLFKEIEELRGMAKRSTFMEHLLELGVKEYKKQQKTQKTTTEPIVDVDVEL